MILTSIGDLVVLPPVLGVVGHHLHQHLGLVNVRSRLWKIHGKKRLLGAMAEDL